MKLAIWGTLAGLILLMGGCTFIAGWSNYDKEVRLRKEITANSNTNEAAFDTMKKIFADKAKVASVSQADLKDIFAEGVKGRVGGSLFKSVQENYPDPAKAQAMWMDLSKTIEAERKSFFSRQAKIQDLVAERASLLEGFMSSKLIRLFGGDTKDFKRRGHPEADGTPDDHQYVFITSTETQRTAESGRDDKPDFELPPRK